MLQALPLASTTVAEEVTLIIPLGLLLITLAWAHWVLFVRGAGREPTVTRPTEPPRSRSAGAPPGTASESSGAPPGSASESSGPPPGSASSG